MEEGELVVEAMRSEETGRRPPRPADLPHPQTPGMAVLAELAVALEAQD